MAVRAREDDVRDLLETDSNTVLTTYIKGANAVIDRVVDCATDRGYTLTSEETRYMEMYVAAHLYSLYDPQYKRKKTERAEGEFFDRDWLAAAKMFDPSGCLESQLSGKRARLIWLGLPPSDQTDYVDRD